jgi:hypothetical protein
VIERTVHLVQHRVYDPPREVEVERDGCWFHALQHSWQLWDDGRGWVAEVEWTQSYYWGVRTVLAVVPAERVRLDDGGHGWADAGGWLDAHGLTALSA